MYLLASLLPYLVQGAAALAAARGDPAESSDDGLTITTTSGQLTGFINSTAPGTRQFLGVPYAEPPLGSLRFQAPVRKQSSDALTTQAFAPSCKQRTSNSTSIYTQYEHQFLINGPDSEDCLYLNVYAPLNPADESLPVFIYIPGGGFTSGGANSLYKIPDKWVDRTQAHVVVTTNYRLNVFGFPGARAATANLGLLDQRAAVEWARDNVAAFGGDPARMVLWGQSAGGGSVGFYPYAWPADPIVAGLIADSGAATDKTFDGTFASFTALAETVGCGGLDADAELACVQAVDADVLEQAVSADSTLTFTPQADNVTVFASVQERIEQGLIAQVPLINGNNDNEGAGFGDGFNETQADWETGLNAIACPVANEVALRAEYDLTTYRYYYAGNFSNISPRPWIGAAHSAELPLLFGTHYEYRGNSTEFEWEVSAVMQELWLSFASNTSADPVSGSITWPKYTADAPTTIYFAADGIASQFIDGSVVDSLCPNSTCPTCAYWNSI